MHPARIITLLSCVLVVAVPLPSLAEDGGDSMIAQLGARAEAPPAPPVDRPELAGLTVPDRLFSMRATDHIRCVRAIADATGDGRDEVIVGIDESQADNIFCLDGASSGVATVVWSQHPISGVSNGSPYGDDSIVPISDPDGNGYQNILVGTAWGGRSAHNLDGLAGAILWTFDTYLEPPYTGGWVYSLAELDDITGDGVPEAVFGAGSDYNHVTMLDGDSSGAATAIWRYDAGDAVYTVRNIGDVNGDGDDDVLAAVGDDIDRLVCLDGGTTNPSGHVLWTYSPGTSVYAAGVLPDITGDGINEALAVLWTMGGGAVRCVNGATGAFIWASTQVTEYGMMVDILDDVTGDGHDEIVVSSWENAVIVLNGLTGGLVWKTTVGTLNGGDVWTARAIDDLNADGFQDVIAGSFDTYAYAMDGTDGTELWSYPTNYRVYSIYPVGDLNADGTPEVVVGNQNQSGSLLEVVHVLDGSDIPAVPDFTLAATPGAVQICAGENAEYTVNVGAISGFSNPVTLAASGHPVGSTAGFAPNPVTPPGSSLLTVGNTAGAAPGSYDISIDGSASGSSGHTVQVGLEVLAPAAPPALTAPPDGAIEQPLRPTFQWSAAAGASSYALEVDDDPAFGSPAIAETGIAGTSFTPSSDLEEETTYHWRVRSENACGPGAASTVFSFTTGSPLPFADGFESGDTSAWSATLP